MGDLEYCEKCINRLEPDRTYYVRTNEHQSKAICSNCHDDYCRLMEMLHSEYGTIGEKQMPRVRDRITKWFYSDGGAEMSLKNAKLTFCNDIASLLEGLDTETAEAFIQWLRRVPLDERAQYFEYWQEVAEPIECME